MYFLVYKDEKAEWRWRLRAKNHKVLADSGEGYKSRVYCLKTIDKVKTCQTAEIVIA